MRLQESEKMCSSCVESTSTSSEERRGMLSSAVAMVHEVFEELKTLKDDT